MKLSKTVFLIIALSFACWVPAIFLYVIRDVFCKECIPAEVVCVGNVLHFANSLINPIAYTCRLSIFRKTLNGLVQRRQFLFRYPKVAEMTSCENALLAIFSMRGRLDPSMYTNTVIAFSVIISIEALIICVGNAFIIFVFWTQFTGSRRRASYLLINLAVADFLIGVTKVPAFMTNSIPSLMRKERSELGGYIAAFVILFSTASVVSLAAVSVERTAAVLWPLAHRTSGDRVYVYCIVFIWMTAMSMFLIYILPFFNVWPFEYAVIALNIVLVLSILTTCLTYIIIRAHLKRSPQIFNSDERKNVERNVKLSKTVFLVIALSFACWVPAVIFYIIDDVFCKECIPAEVVLVGTVLHFANSLVNPIAYTCRLSVFKKTL
ncbi:unnamed protein product, partial [Porites evermanni]